MSSTAKRHLQRFWIFGQFSQMLALAAFVGCKASSGSGPQEGMQSGGSGGSPSGASGSGGKGNPGAGGSQSGGGAGQGGTAVSSDGGFTSSSGGASSSSGGASSSSGGFTSSSGGASGSGGAKQTGNLRIMPLGDSITETTCQTQLTWKNLQDAKRTNFDLVGSRQNQQSCGVANVDRDCEGHGGYLVTELTGSGKRASEPSGWFSSGKADVVLMHFGTNDVWNGIAPTVILSAYSTLVDGLRAVNPGVILFVAQIIPLAPPDCAECGTRVTTLNAQIPAWAEGKSSAASPIYVVDQWTGFNAASDTGDGVHPNLAGSQKIADKWSAALLQRSIL